MFYSHSNAMKHQHGHIFKERIVNQRVNYIKENHKDKYKTNRTYNHKNAVFLNR